MYLWVRIQTQIFLAENSSLHSLLHTIRKMTIKTSAYRKTPTNKQNRSVYADGYSLPIWKLNQSYSNHHPLKASCKWIFKLCVLLWEDRAEMFCWREQDLKCKMGMTQQRARLLCGVLSFSSLENVAVIAIPHFPRSLEVLFWFRKGNALLRTCLISENLCL